MKEKKDEIERNFKGRCFVSKIVDFAGKNCFYLHQISININKCTFMNVDLFHY